jgi:type VI secretion system protein ImpL
MKRLAINLLKILFGLIGLAALLLLIFGAGWYLGWPWWVGGFILLGLCGLALALAAARKIWLRRREQRFVTQIVDQDDRRLRQMQERDRRRGKELQDRWKAAVDQLRASHLRKLGNPLYVLPWYMVIGESGSGKTTAIQSARLSSSFAEVGRASGISGTRDCDWWFFERAVILDTAGRYTIPVDEGRDKEEWQKFLTLLLRYRGREPINGVVVAVAADKLLESPPEALEDDAKSIRRRLNELMRSLGARFPVYVLVTKCDLIQGMAPLCDQLSEKALRQAMGVLQHRAGGAADFAARAIQTVCERLRDYRLLILNKPGIGGHPGSSVSAEPALLLFPEEFERLRPGLERFVAAAFQETPYTETPLLRGLYFSSGRQEGRPYSHFLKELGLIAEREMLPGTNRGLFLHDFFDRILPADRDLLAPTERAVSWNRLTKNLGLAAWLAVGVAVCGLLSFSFAKHLGAFTAISNTLSQVEDLRGDLVTDIGLMQDFYNKIDGIRSQSFSGWLPRFGLHQSEEVERAVRSGFCRRFENRLLGRMDEHLEKAVAQFSPATPGRQIGDTVAHLIGRIRLLKAHIAGDRLEALAKLPLSAAPMMIAQVEPLNLAGVRAGFNRLYATYVDWNPDPARAPAELARLQKLVLFILSKDRDGFRWLPDWADHTVEAKPLTLADFWGTALNDQSLPRVAPAFSRPGKAAVEAFLEEIEAAVGDVAAFDFPRRRAEFAEWYRAAAFQSWQQFAEVFPKGLASLQGRETGRRAAALMSTEQNPFFQLLERMASELRPFEDGGEPTPFAQRVIDYGTAKLQAAAGEIVAKPPGLIQKAAEKIKSQAGRIEKQVGARPERAWSIENRLASGQHLKDYQKHLLALAGACATREAAFQVGVAMFRETPAAGQSPVLLAQRSLEAFRGTLPGLSAEPEAFWALVRGPLDFLKFFVLAETGCHLQQLWEKEVLLPSQQLPDKSELPAILLGPQGSARKFVEGPAAPFIDQSLARGYYARTAIDSRPLPFEAEFLNFMNRGYRAPPKPAKESYTVTLEGAPTGANADARIQPSATRLEVQCADKTLSLVNRNYPARQTFTWSPTTCGDTVLQIEVGNMVLTQQFTGPLGFAKFLQLFYRGEVVFPSRQFGAERSALESLGIQAINVKYHISGHEPVVQLLAAPPPVRVPTHIIACESR